MGRIAWRRLYLTVASLTATEPLDRERTRTPARAVARLDAGWFGRRIAAAPMSAPGSIHMSSTQIPTERISRLSEHPPADGQYVLYWMQQSQRAECNHALEHAAERANAMSRPLLVCFALTDDYPEANARHYRFMLEGLRETQSALEKRGIRMIVQQGRPDELVVQLGREASLVICDRGYLRHQKQWREQVARRLACEVTQVESDVVVPVQVASGKAEWAARTLRPKIHAHVERFLVALRSTPVRQDSLSLQVDGLKLDDVEAVLKRLELDHSVPAATLFRGGASEGRRILRRFVTDHLAHYQENRNQPQTDDVSHMSKYLHFGQISPIEVALAVRDAARGRREDVETFLEELLVRRELSHNFVHYTANYDQYECLPAWAQKTLHRHQRDRRPHLYSREQLDNAATHDPYWNAAMREMRFTGYMHNYMRMYWGKKILEWSATPQEAFETALALNNRYFIDGRDPVSFANVAWVFGLHDRPWAERPIFGTVRYMSADGLRRKCDIDGYVAKVERLVQETGGPASPGQRTARGRTAPK